MRDRLVTKVVSRHMLYILTHGFVSGILYCRLLLCFCLEEAPILPKKKDVLEKKQRVLRTSKNLLMLIKYSFDESLNFFTLTLIKSNSSIFYSNKAILITNCSRASSNKYFQTL